MSASSNHCNSSCSPDADMQGDAGSSGDPPPPQVQAPDEGRDLLTCGQCSQSFPLAHILAFIQHKQGGCSSRSGAADPSGAAPPSPANRAGRQQVPGTRPGFIELRRGGARDRVWGEELRSSVKAEPGKSGESRKEAQQGGRLLMSDFLLLLFRVFFFHPPWSLFTSPPPLESCSLTSRCH